MAVQDDDKMKHKRSWRKPKLSTPSNAVFNKPNKATKRSRLKDSSRSTIKKIFQPSANRREKSLHRIKDSTLFDRGEPSDSSSNDDNAFDQPSLSAVVESSPDLILHRPQPTSTVEDFSMSHGALHPSLTHVQSEVTMEKKAPMPDAQSHHSDTVTAQLGMVAPEPSPSPSEGLPMESANALDPIDNVSTKSRPETTDAGSAPTKIFNVSDGSESKPELPPEPSSDLQRKSGGLHGLEYKLADDIAGLMLPPGPVKSIVDPKGMSLELDSLARQVLIVDLHSQHGSLTPFLVAPVSYVEYVVETAISAEEDTVHSRKYVSAWIFMSVTKCRIDGLRLNLEMHVSFRDSNATSKETFLPKPAKIARLATTNWFSDPANGPVNVGILKSPVAQNRPRRSPHTRPCSLNSSMIPAVTNSSYRDRKKQILAATRTSHAEQQVEDLPEDTGEVSPWDRIGGVSALSKNHEPLVIGQEPLFDVSKDENASTQAHRAFTVAEARVAQISNIDDVRDTKTDVTTKSTTHQRDNTSAEGQKGRSANSSMVSDKGVQQNHRVSGNEQLTGKRPSCKERDFVSESELADRMDALHSDDDYSDDEEHRLKHGPHRTAVQYFAGPDSSSDTSPEDNHLLPLETPRRQDVSVNDFRVRPEEEAIQFFVTGCVFDVLWYETSNPRSSPEKSSARDSSLDMTTASRGGTILSPTRRFIVMNANGGWCHASPVYVSDRWNSVRNVPEGQRRRHTSIYDSKKLPESIPQECLFCTGPIPVQIDAGETLDGQNYIDFDELQRVDWNTKVKKIGMVMGDQNLRDLPLRFAMEGSKERAGVGNKDEYRSDTDPDRTVKQVDEELRRTSSTTTWTDVGAPEQHSQDDILSTKQALQLSPQSFD